MTKKYNPNRDLIFTEEGITAMQKAVAEMREDIKKASNKGNK